ncbi:MAG: hypothetical protein N4A65_03780 [Cohaesibacter sp.]|jgi:hypothetical protein|nr:hypothetical protein [Cohaesibacter sp.]
MTQAFAKRMAVVATLTLFFFWETASYFSTNGSFCADCYNADSQTFLMAAPPLLMIWLFRNALFPSIGDKARHDLKEQRDPDQDASG